MTPEQKLKWAVLDCVAKWGKKTPPQYPCSNVDELYALAVENGEHWDGVNEIRCGKVETGLPCEPSRHYESKAVAMQFPDGSWIGWTYWYGGGKHAEPESIEWMNESYDLTCHEEEKMVVIRKFEKHGAAA